MGASETCTCPSNEWGSKLVRMKPRLDTSLEYINVLGGEDRTGRTYYQTYCLFKSLNKKTRR